MQLEDLLQHCTVKLSIPGQLGWGTGFFVAPGLILTCAHVVQALVAPHRVRVRWQQQLDFAEAELIQRFPDLDLALLQFTPRKADLPCVYLDEGLQAGQDLYFFGYPDADFEHGCPVTGSCEGLTGDVSPLIKFKQAQVRRGMSGSALLNRQTGKVCGMVKFTLHRSSDLGGGAIPTTVILEQFPELRSLQRSFHGGDRRWSDLLSKVFEIDFQAYWGAIARHYEQWWQLYTLTDVEGQQQAQKAQPFFDFGLIVQPVVPQDDLPDRATAKEKVERFTVLAGLRKYVAPDQDLPHVLLVGRPGSGKSTALARLMLERVESRPIPVLVELRSWQSSVLDLIRAFFQRHELKLAIADIQALLDDCKLLLLIDGVNELPSEAARNDVANFRRNHPKVPMIFTTRDLSLGGDLGIEKKLEMQPLTETQMQAFVRAYIPENAEAMLRQLKGRLRELGQTPLLLWMLCSLFQRTEQIPQNLGKVFRSFTQGYEQQIKQDMVVESDRRWWPGLLQELAILMMQGNSAVDPQLILPPSKVESIFTEYLSEREPQPAGAARKALDDLLKHHLIQWNGDSVEFRHQLIQEYYAAEWLLSRVENLDDYTLKRDYLNYLKWTEPVALMLALVDDEALAVRVVEQALDVDLMLGARLAGEARSGFQEVMIKTLDQKARGNQAANWLIIRLFAETKARSTIPYLSNIIQNCEDVVDRRQATWALRNSSLESAIPAFKISLEDPDHSVREQAIWALGESKSKESIPLIMSALQDPSPQVRERMVYALAEIPSSDSIYGILQILSDAQQRDDALRSGKIEDAWKEPANESNIVTMAKYTFEEELSCDVVVPVLIQALITSQESYERQYAAEILGTIAQASDNSVVQALTDAVQSIDDEVSFKAGEALHKLEAKAHHENSEYQIIQNSIINTGQEVVQIWIDRLKSPNAIERGNAVIELAHLLERSAAIEIIKDALKDESHYVKSHAIRLFVEFVGCESLNIVKQFLYDKHPTVQESAVQALVKIQELSPDKIQIKLREEFICHLIKEIRENPQPYIRGKFTKVLTDLFVFQNDLASRSDIKTALLEAIETQDYLLRSYALTGLKKIQDKDVVNCLEVLLTDSDELISLTASEALGEMPQQLTAEILPRLKRLIFAPVRNSAIAAISAIQSNCKFYNYEIFHSRPTKPQSTQQDTLAKIEQTVDILTKTMSDQPTISITGGTFNAPLNLAPNQGHQPTTIIIGTQNNYFGADAALLQQITDLQQFITELETQHPHIQTLPAAEAARDQAITYIQATNPTRWQTIRHQMHLLKRQLLSPERHAQATKASLVEVTKKWCENSLIATAIITYIDKLSETPDQGA
jgi:HEAT repeat protein